MATKYSVIVDGQVVRELSRKDAAVKYGENGASRGLAGTVSFQVQTSNGTVVHEFTAEQPHAGVTGKVVHEVDNTPHAGPSETATPAEIPAEETAPAEAEQEPVFYEFLDFPGNYSIVMAPFAEEIAEAAGVPTRVTSQKGTLTRRVEFGGNDMDLTARTVSHIQEQAQAAHENLRAWQKTDAERRRGLTDMQRYLEHREFLAEQGHLVAARVRKDGI